MSDLVLVEHSGVKGMHWGHRKTTTIGKKEKLKKKLQLHEDYRYFGRNFETYMKTPVKDLTPEQRRIGKKIAMNALLLCGSMTTGQYVLSVRRTKNGDYDLKVF